VKRNAVSLAILTVLMVILGTTIVAQFRARGRVRGVSSVNDEQAMLLAELVNANTKLRAEIEALQEQQAAYEGNTGATGLQQLVAELNRVKVFNGLVEVSGPGVELLMDGSLNALDLQDTVNELRNAGAEAISLNGYRVVVNSVIMMDAKGQVTLDGQPISRPYQFWAIGEPETIETALIRPGGLVALLRRTYPNLIVQSTQHSRLVIGVHRPPLEFTYAQLVE
jgi:uncharacterized protein YlxW (UPF0749 family)